MSGIILKKNAATSGKEKMVIQKTGSTGARKLHLFPGSNQVVLASAATAGTAVADYGTYKSFDSGETFVKQPDDYPVLAGSNIAVSFNNRYYYVGDPSTIDGSSYIAQSSNGGNTWEYKQPSVTDTRRFTSVSSSRDGMHALAVNGAYNDNGDVYLTQDFGETWTSPLLPNQFFRTFMDPEGQNMLVGGFTNTYYSNNYGSNWTVFSETLVAFGGAMISGDGNYKVVFEQYRSSEAGALVHVSTDWINWTQNILTVRLIGGSISNDGKYMLIASTDGYNSDEQYVNLSTNYGQTWSKIDLTGGIPKKWSGTAMSSDGKYMIVIPGLNADGYAYKSTDYGQSWGLENKIPLGRYNTVKMSKSGRYVYVTGTNEGIHVSNDYMASWHQHFDASTGSGLFINF